MSKIDRDEFMVAMTHLANKYHFENSHQLFLYSKFLEKPLPRNNHHHTGYRRNWDILNKAFGAHDRVDTFELNGYLFAAIDTRHDRGSALVTRSKNLKRLTGGLVGMGHEL